MRAGHRLDLFGRHLDAVNGSGKDGLDVADVHADCCGSGTAPRTLLRVGDDALAGEAGEFLRSEVRFKLVEAVGLAAEEGFADLGKVTDMQLDDGAERGCGVDGDGIDALATLDSVLGLPGPGFGLGLQPEGAGCMFAPCDGPALANGPRVAYRSSP